MVRSEATRGRLLVIAVGDMLLSLRSSPPPSSYLTLLQDLLASCVLGYRGQVGGLAAKAAKRLLRGVVTRHHCPPHALYPLHPYHSLHH